MNLQSSVFSRGVMNESHFSKTVHEEADPRAGGSHHLRQGFLTDLWKYTFLYPFFAKTRQHEKDAGQTLFAGIEQLVNQIFFVPDVPRQQVGDEHFGEGRFAVQRLHHGVLLNPKHGAIGDRSCGVHAEWLTGKRSLTEEAPVAQNANRRFFAGLGNNCELDLSCLEIKNRVGGIPLRKNSPLLWKEHGFSALADCG